MSIASFERELVDEARRILKNPKLRKKDLQEWSTSDIAPREDEVVIDVPRYAFAAFKKECDKR